MAYGGGSWDEASRLLQEQQSSLSTIRRESVVPIKDSCISTVLHK